MRKSLIAFMVLLLMFAAGCFSQGEKGKEVTKIDPDIPPQGVKASSTTKIIEINQPVIVEEFCELTLKAVEFTPVVKPPNPDSYYSYYQVEQDDVTFLHIVANIKNLQNLAQDADSFIDIKAIYDNKYEYEGFATIEEKGGGDFTYISITSIDPLMTEVVHFLIEVPKEVEESEDKPLGFVVTVKDEQYQYKIR
jgi:hypothetical protein